jgi:hypothetical protein
MNFPRHGEVSERFKEHAWKACVGETQPWVRIPPSPPFSHNLSFSELFSSRNIEFAAHNAGILQDAMISALKNKQTAGAANDVLDQREERNDPLYYRLFKSFLRGSYEGSLNAHKLKLVDSECILEFTVKVVRHAASAGNCVMVGRGSQLILRDHPDALRVFLYAPREDKLRRLLSRGKSEQEAQELVETVDLERANFVEKYFKVEWPSRSVYHTMINTAIGDETVVQTIVDFMRTLDSKLTARV